MEQCFAFLLRACGSCVSHSHCRDCCSQAEENLLQKSWIQRASADPAKKLLTVESQEDRDTLADLLDDMGIFVQG
ncbi:MAG: hypothetical protein IKM59_02270 [Oscillospiraceae bacterium]|nr:hypothetical protein [Oscillospiraceae bacterium]